MFDALIGLVTGIEHHHPQTATGAEGGATDPGPTTAARADGAAARTDAGAAGGRSEPIRSKRYTPATCRPTIVVGVTLDKFSGLDPDQAAELIGVGPIADSVLAEYLNADAILIGALFGRDGQPLWWGRNARFATDTQHLALIIRDKGCVRCGKHHLHCQAHHLTPWNAPAQGKTDINKLALLCGDCHRQLHADNHTLYRHHSGTWRTRPATPNETPPQPLNRPGNGTNPQRE
jgi:hypothetical protein